MPPCDFWIVIARADAMGNCIWRYSCCTIVSTSTGTLMTCSMIPCLNATICMNGSRDDTRRALIGSNAGNLCCLGGYTNPFECDNVGTLAESSGVLHVAHSLKLAPSSPGNV
ncbi:hypothetical protein TNCT_366781 [Trichonephila clavata]|uniref:Uncharacterized protein n=1 Tax=Trichonephila clavata TaxID=2740835 RepID=A0A8X6HYZ4_TRICU|nr:hypothetical protein TNCT_366781 [Trichonephila clavata]